MQTNAYIDAANLFYGGVKSLGWRIDYEKLFQYLKDKYVVDKVFFFGGVEIHKFMFDYLKHDSVPLEELERYFVWLLESKADRYSQTELELFAHYLKRVRFYLKIKKFGYQLILKPVKIFNDSDGRIIRKANCDVDMTFSLMRDSATLDRVLFLSGDGDFLPVLKFLKELGKEVFVFARGPRTAREIRNFAGGNFRDFEYLRTYLEFERDL